MEHKVHIGIWIVLALEALLGLFVLLIGLAFSGGPNGRPAPADMLIISIPLLLVFFGALLAFVLARSGRTGLAWLGVLPPLVVVPAFLGFGLVI